MQLPPLLRQAVDRALSGIPLADLAATAAALPKTALDIGAGPGTALWAPTDCWSDLDDALLIEASPAFRARGQELAAEAPLRRVVWRAADVTTGSIDCAPRDLVTASYMLNELAPPERLSLVERLWQ